jgi:hypothetical protein
VTDAEARIQGVKGRRLQVFAPMAAHAAGVLFVEEPSVVASDRKSVVERQAIKWYAHPFLETRLRELPWTVRPWYDDFGPLERHDVDERALLLSTVVYHQGGIYHVDPQCRPLQYRPPRRLSEVMARREGMTPCRSSTRP